MSEELKQEPQRFRDFDELYHKLVRCDWHDPMLEEHMRDFAAFLCKHRDLYTNK